MCVLGISRSLSVWFSFHIWKFSRVVYTQWYALVFQNVLEHNVNQSSQWLLGIPTTFLINQPPLPTPMVLPICSFLSTPTVASASTDTLFCHPCTGPATRLSATFSFCLCLYGWLFSVSLVVKTQPLALITFFSFREHLYSHGFNDQFKAGDSKLCIPIPNLACGTWQLIQMPWYYTKIIISK